MRVSISVVLFIAAVSKNTCHGAFLKPSPSVVNKRQMRLKATQESEILAAYQKRIGVKVATTVDTAVAPTLPDTPPVTPVIDTAPVVVEKVAKVAPKIVTSSSPTTAATPGTDPISSLWNKIAHPLQKLPDPFEKTRIPKEPFKDVDIKLDIPKISTESFKDVSIPNVDSIKESLKSVSSQVPDFKESLKSVSVPDIKPSDFTTSLKSIDMETVKNNVNLEKVSESVKNIQLPTPPERPVAPGVILPDGGRLPTLMDWWETHASGNSLDGLTSTLEHVKASFASFQNSLKSFPAMVEALRISEFGAWYFAGLCLVAWQVSLSQKEKVYTAKLSEAEKKAQQAAEAASLAAQGATLTKELATKKSAKTNISTERILSDSQMHAMELEKEAMKKELESLQQETEALKRQLKAATSTTTEVNGVEAPVKAPKHAQPKKVEPRDPKEDVRVLQIIKDVDVANASATKPKPKKKAAAPKKAAPKKAPAKKRAPRKKVVKEEVVAVLEKEPVVAVEEEVLEVEVTGAKDVFFANATATAKAKKAAPKKAKKAAPKKAAVKKATPVAASSDNPWSSLSPSTLKRKTVKELSAYLSERGVQVTNEEGKPLKKAVLVDAVGTL